MLLVARGKSDGEVTGLSPTHCADEYGSQQAAYTHVALSSSSAFWYYSERLVMQCAWVGNRRLYGVALATSSHIRSTAWSKAWERKIVTASHQRTFSHCSYHTSPLDHCGQATHRGWPFLFASRAFSVAAPTVWNSLPDNVITADTLATFKKRLKTHLFHCVMWNVLATERLCISYHGAIQVLNILYYLAASPLGGVVCIYLAWKRGVVALGWQVDVNIWGVFV